MVYYLISTFTPLTIVSNAFMRNGIYQLMFIGRIYNSENKRKRNDSQIFEPCLRKKELWKMGVTVLPIVVGALGTVLKRIRGTGNQRKNREHPIYVIVKIGLNTEKTPGDLSKLK